MPDSTDPAGLILIGMPGIAKRLARYPQLYSRIGFAHHYRPLGKDELTFVLTQHWRKLGLELDTADFSDAQAIAAIARIASGNFRLIQRLFVQILPPAVAAGPTAGRRGGLACRPGPQASTLHSARPVKSPGAGAGLAPGPQPRAGTGRCPPGQAGTALGEGRPPGGYRKGGTVARITKVPATAVSAPASGGQPGTGVPARGQRVMVAEGSVMGWLVSPAAAFPFTTEIGF